MNKDFLMEIGVEELPSNDVWSSIEQLKQKTPYLLKAQNLKAGDIFVYGTPRRLVIHIKNIGENEEIDSGCLEALSVSLIKSLKFEKSMRWLSGNKTSFSRPIRWLLVFFGNKLVEIEYAGIKSKNISFGPRFLLSPEFKVTSVIDYFKQIEKQKIILDQEKRREMIIRQNNELASEVNGIVLEDQKLLDEVIQLVEYPTSIRGDFDKRFLEIPQEVAITVMKKHQRYFPIRDTRVNLLPYFITVANQLKENVLLIREGNEKVIAARLSDGEFFYKQDREHNLSHFVPKLKEIVLHEKLGSVYDKSERLEKMIPFLIKIFNLQQQEQIQDLERAAHLCKADLATSLVAELPNLQGEIGQIYAREDKENRLVAEAIFEHYLPRFSGDVLPKSTIGQILAIADKADTLTGFFAAGVRPKGSEDPYALRRTAQGLVQILAEVSEEVKLTELFLLSRQYLPVKLSEEVIKNELLNFIKDRIKTDLKEEGIDEDIIKAVLSGAKSEYVNSVYKITRLLSSLKKESWFKDFIMGAKRVINILDKIGEIKGIDENLFVDQSEKELYKAYLETQKIVTPLIEKNEFEKVIRSYQNLVGPINDFFEKVMVMDENEEIRNNHLALLVKVKELLESIFQPSYITEL